VRIRAVALVLAAVSAGTAAGCGATDRAPDAATVAERFHAALDEDDGEAACSELSEETAGKLEQQAEAPWARSGSAPGSRSR
jgi:hypothetical protein